MDHHWQGSGLNHQGLWYCKAWTKLSKITLDIIQIFMIQIDTKFIQQLENF